MLDHNHGASPASAPSRTRHMRRLMAAEFTRRSVRVVRRASPGQTLIIFALTFTILIGFMGLAIDSIRLYNQYARMQRAAEAGALAGVIYMPNNYTTDVPISPPGDNAVCRAEKEVFKNSFGTGCSDPTAIGANYCPNVKSSVEVAVCNTGEPYQLEVFITEPINVLFLSALNVGPLTLTASSTAAYLPPVNIASDPTGTGSTGSWGTFGECSGASSACTGTGSVRNWAGNINGPGELKEQGDPLVTCAEGPGSPVNADSNAASSTPYTTYTGLPTNHPQSVASNAGCGNTDAQGAFTGPSYTNGTSLGTAPLRTGYAYLVNIPQGATDNLWIWNAPFSPSPPKSCNGRAGGQKNSSYDVFYEYSCKGSSGTAYTNYPGTSCTTKTDYTCQDPRLYFSVTYSIYQLSGPTDINGTLKATFTAWPYAGQGSCGNGQYQTLPAIASPYNNVLATGLSTTSGVCISSPCVANWCPLYTNQLGDNRLNIALSPIYPLTGPAAGSSSPSTFYRVMVVASDYGDPTNPHLGWGGHAYSLKICPTGTTQSGVQTCSPGLAALGGWNVSDAVFIFPGNGAGSTPQTTEYPLGVIDSSFAGRTLDVQLYDPGDLSGNNGAPSGTTLYAVAPPTGASDPCSASTAQLTSAGYTSTNFVFPSPERTSTLNSLPALEPALNGDLLYNGLWVEEQITVPANYQFSGSTWTLCAQAPQTTDADVLGIGVFALGQSPVHLVN